MANEILKDEILKDEQLDQVAGGTLAQTNDDIRRFARETGFRFHGNDSQQREQLRDILYRCGIKIKDHGGVNNNEYFLLDRKGNRIRTLNENEAMNTAIHNYRNKKFIC
ncbi:MAG: hypothetical protein IJG32_09205 [Selenomonadaceae bacterium]|nr:hypothetical protein [Selenomonadaceae bacterium]MBQ4405367.1 hypothetical protein [Selenomonadaceae bacterium]